MATGELVSDNDDGHCKFTFRLSSNDCIYNVEAYAVLDDFDDVSDDMSDSYCQITIEGSDGINVQISTCCLPWSPIENMVEVKANCTTNMLKQLIDAVFSVLDSDDDYYDYRRDVLFSLEEDFEGVTLPDNWMSEE